MSMRGVITLRDEYGRERNAAYSPGLLFRTGTYRDVPAIQDTDNEYIPNGGTICSCEV